MPQPLQDFLWILIQNVIWLSSFLAGVLECSMLYVYVVCNTCTSHYQSCYCAVQLVHLAPYSAYAVQPVHLAFQLVGVECNSCTVHLP